MKFQGCGATLGLTVYIVSGMLFLAAIRPIVDDAWMETATRVLLAGGVVGLLFCLLTCLTEPGAGSAG